MKKEIQEFLDKKDLASNSKAAYGYDLEQFIDQVGQTGISEHALRLYEASLSQFKPTVQKRKVSAVNQFLFFLYEKGGLAHFHRIHLPKEKVELVDDKKLEVLELEAIWQTPSDSPGRLLALLMLELGLQPSEILQLKVEHVQLDFRILRVKKAGQQRILEIPAPLLTEIEPYMTGIYIMGSQDKPYSRQWAFRQLESFLKEAGLKDLTAQKLREQHILRRREKGHDIHDIARDLGLKTSLTLEKYR